MPLTDRRARPRQHQRLPKLDALVGASVSSWATPNGIDALSTVELHVGAEIALLEIDETGETYCRDLIVNDDEVTGDLRHLATVRSSP